MSGTISPQWSVAQCCEWLQSIGMGSYSSAFQAQQVDGALLLNLDDEMLQELGMDSKLQRTRLLLKRDAASVSHWPALSSRSARPVFCLDWAPDAAAARYERSKSC